MHFVTVKRWASKKYCAASISWNVTPLIAWRPGRTVVRRRGPVGGHPVDGIRNSLCGFVSLNPLLVDGGILLLRTCSTPLSYCSCGLGWFGISGQRLSRFLLVWSLLCCMDKGVLMLYVGQSTECLVYRSVYRSVCIYLPTSLTPDQQERKVQKVSSTLYWISMTKKKTQGKWRRLLLEM